MIRLFFIIIAVLATVTPGRRLSAQSVSPDSFMPNAAPKGMAEPEAPDSKSMKYTLLMPGEKSSEQVKETERNPFSGGADDLHDTRGKASNEETKIVELLNQLQATGISPGADGLRILLGDMWLSKDDIMPPLVKDQTLFLRVKKVSREAVELVWLEKKSTGLPPRVVTLPVDLRATVRRAPHGQVMEKKENKTESKATKIATFVEMPRPLAARSERGRDTGALEIADDQDIKTAPKALPAEEAANAIVQAAPEKPSPPKEDKPATQPTPPLDNDLPAALVPLDPQLAGPPAPLSRFNAPPAPTEASPAPAPVPAPAPATPQDDKKDTLASASVKGGNEPQPHQIQPAPAPPAEPAAWKRALGLMDNMVKLSEAGK